MLQGGPSRTRGDGVGWRVAAWAVAATSALLVLGAVGVAAYAGRAPGELAYWLMDLLSAVVYAAAVVVVLPRSRHPVAWVLVLVALGCGAAALATAYPLLAARHDVPFLAAVTVAAWWVWVPGTYASVAVVPWLVVPGPRSRPVRLVLALAVATVAASVLRVATYPFPGLDHPTAVHLDAWAALVRAVGLWPDRLVLLLGLAGTAWLVRQRLRAPGDAGRGLGWLAVGVLLLVVALAPVLLSSTVDDLVLELSGVGLVLAQAFLPVALLVLVLRQRLWGVDLAVSRVTVWALLTGSVVLGYAGAAWLLGRLLPVPPEVAGPLAAGVVVALGQPLRWWIQGRVDALVYGHGPDPVRLLGALQRADGGPDGTTGPLGALVAGLRQGLRLGWVEVRSDDGQVHARDGVPLRPEAERPLVVEGREIGRLRLAAVPGQRLDRRTLAQLDQVLSVVAVALDLARTSRELEAAGHRLLEVRVEERRMLRRDLHDGMGPALAGVGLGLAAAQRRLHHDPEGTTALLAELQAEVERRTDDLRLLARSLLPSQLDDGDLATALEVLADRFAASGLDVRVECRGAEELDTRRQLAVYHVAAEAVLNAHRHAAARRVDVQVAAGAGRPTRLVVRDDGRGISPASRRGVGLASMRERASELGGTLLVSPTPAGVGTLIRMELP